VTKDGFVRDPKGNKLSCVLLLVVERDERGPRLLRYCHDDETMDLATAGVADEKPTFYVVWAPSDATLAETDLSQLDEAARERVERVFGARFQSTRDELERLRAAHAKVVALDEEKTIELRLLHQERDPKRFDTAVRERVDASTAELQTKLRAAAIENADQKRQIEELQRSKRKLRDALDRLKDVT
jgi:PAS domain-containing protein